MFWSGVVRVIIFGAIQIPVMLVIAFFFATAFDLGVAKYGRLFRTVFFIPFAVPVVVAALMWGFLFEPVYGPFSHLANLFGFPAVDFLSSGLMLPSIIVIAIWEWTGYNMPDPVHRAAIGAQGHHRGGHPGRHAAVEDHRQGEAADGAARPS